MKTIKFTVSELLSAGYQDLNWRYDESSDKYEGYLANILSGNPGKDLSNKELKIINVCKVAELIPIEIEGNKKYLALIPITESDITIKLGTLSSNLSDCMKICKLISDLEEEGRNNHKFYMDKCNELLYDNEISSRIEILDELDLDRFPDVEIEIIS